MFKTAAYALLVVFVIVSFLSSCEKSETTIDEAATSTEQLEIPDGFNLEMDKSTGIDVTISNGSETVFPKIKASLFNSIPEIGGRLMTSSLSDDGGKVKFAAKIPGHLNEVFLQFGYVGLPNGVWINSETGNVIEKSDEYEGFTLPEQNPIVSTKATTSIPFEYLGTFDSNGAPAYLENERDEVSADFLKDVNASLPERMPLTQSHPGYITSDENINIEITEEADVWITFLHEGAGNKNVLGFYTYAKGSKPASASQITKHTVIFPNTSYYNSGGGLYSGDKVLIGRFPKDTVIGFFLISAGFAGTVSSAYRQVFYSDTNLNPETDLKLKQHNVFIWDEKRELVLMGFEDTKRDGSGCDNDFNDAVFYITSNPVEAIDTTVFKPIDTPKDTDKDGVSDVFDEFPEDPERAFNNYYPAKDQLGSLAFEDSWPKQGDYDFNDAFFHFNYNYVTNAKGDVVEIIALFRAVALGAAYYNGPAMLFDFTSDKIKSVTGQKLFDKVFDVNENGTEKGLSSSVIPVTDNLHKLMNNNSGKFVNTDPELPFVEPVDVNIKIEFTAPLKISETGLPPYNPFLVVNKNRAKEIHLAGKINSSKADIDIFGTQDDNTNPASGNYYKTASNLPWAISIPYEVNQMIERKDILSGYLNFGNWAQSGGNNKKDWYIKEVEGNTVEKNIYTKK